MIVEDFVMLGKTVPEEQADGRVFVCSAGWSRELRSLIRIYPLGMSGAPPKWSVCRVALERNPRDSRAESWKIGADRSPDAHGEINSQFVVLDTLCEQGRESLMTEIEQTTICAANEARTSLAVVQPDFAPELRFSDRPESDNHPQMWIFAPDEKPEMGAARFPFQPRIKFVCNGARHDLQLREWGAYEWMRKNDWDGRNNHPIRGRLKSNPRLLVGNMNGHRNVWLVIDVLRAVTQIDMFAPEMKRGSE